MSHPRIISSVVINNMGRIIPLSVIMAYVYMCLMLLSKTNTWLLWNVCHAFEIFDFVFVAAPVAPVYGLRHYSAFPVGSRSIFMSYRPDYTKPNWFRVGLSFGTSAFLMGLLFKQHSTDVQEYKARNCME